MHHDRPHAPDERAPLDVDAIAEIRSFEAGLLERFIERFLRDASHHVATARQALRLGRLDEVARLAHQLVATAGNVGAARACAGARAVEEAALCGERAEAERALLHLEAECALVTPQLEALLARPRDEPPELDDDRP